MSWGRPEWVEAEDMGSNERGPEAHEAEGKSGWYQKISISLKPEPPYSDRFTATADLFNTNQVLSIRCRS